MACYRKHTGHSNSSITAASLVKHSNFLLTGGNDSQVLLHNLGESVPAPISFPKSHVGTISAIDVSEGNEFCVSAALAHVVMFDLAKQTKIRKLSNYIKEDSSSSASPAAHRDEVLDCILLNNDLMACCGINHRLNLFDLRQNKHTPVFTVNLGNDNLNAIAFNTSTSVISAGSSNGSLYSLDIRSSQVITDTFGTSASIIGVCKDEDLNFVSFDTGDVVVADAVKGTVHHRFSVSGHEPMHYKHNLVLNKPNGSLLTGTERGTVQIWSLDRATHRTVPTRILPCDAPSEKSAIISIVCNDDEANRLIAIDGDGCIHVWEPLF